MISRHMSSSAGAQAKSADKWSNVEGVGADSVVKASTSFGVRTMTLNRPKALNALNEEMIDAIKPLLEGWENSQSCNLVVFKGEGRAFCAGGDVVSLVKYAQDPATRSKASAFFAKEYECDRYIAHMKKPIVALLDGITMGGGVGLSVHAPFRIATEKTRFAMPETNIGLFPDVGANFFLSRLDGEIGTYLGLTSVNILGYGVYQAGIATHYVPSEQLPALEERLAALDFTQDEPSTSAKGYQKINSCIEEFVADANSIEGKPSPLVGLQRKAIDACFGFKRAEEIVSALQQVENGSHKLVKDSSLKEQDVTELQKWAKETRETIELRSPTSVKVALEGIRLGAKMTIDEVFDLDMQLASVCCTPDLAPDFVTGVTHLLINKKPDKPARAAWSPATLSEVSQQHVRSTFFDMSPKTRAAAQIPKLAPLPSSVQTYKSYPHQNFALPSEKLIEKVIKGELQSSGSLALTRSEVVDWFKSEWSDKAGLMGKLDEVLARKTKEGADGSLVWKS